MLSLEEEELDFGSTSIFLTDGKLRIKDFRKYWKYDHLHKKLMVLADYFETCFKKKKPLGMNL